MATMDPMKRCELCGHSRAAHGNGVKCALCQCRSERVEVVQQSFAFRGVITAGGGRPNRRKREAHPQEKIVFFFSFGDILVAKPPPSRKTSPSPHRNST